MSVVVEKVASHSENSQRPPVEEPAQGRPSLPDASVLEDKTPQWFRTPGVASLFTAVIGVIFVVMSHLPLAPNDLWDHVNYGAYTLEHQQVARFEPLLELARGVPIHNVYWLSQVGMSLLIDRFGPASLQFTHALFVSVSLGLVAWIVVRRSGSVVAALFAVAMFLTLNHLQFQIARPQTAGVLCFTIVAVWSLKPQFRPAEWMVIPAVFVIWANCHPSFPAGILLLAAMTLGYAIDIGRHSPRFVIAHPVVIRMLLMTQLATAAVLLNPCGLGIWTEVLSISGHPNIESMYEWMPLTLRTVQGKMMAASGLLLMFLIKMSPRRVRLIEVLPLVVFGLFTLWSSRMINWWAPLASITAAVHLAPIARGLSGKFIAANPRRRTNRFRATGLWTIVSLGLCWIFFALTNFGVIITQGRQPEVRKLVTRDTPLDLAGFLNDQDTLPGGIAWVPAEWSGFLRYAGPETLNPMVNLHVHVIPQDVWEHYVRLTAGPTDWDDLLDQYSINMVIVDKDRQPGLMKRLAESDAWNVQYSDRQSIVFFRRSPV